MNRTIDKIRQNPKTSIYILGFIAAIVATAIETIRLRYMNYLVYTDSTLDFWNGINPYTQDFVNEHGRYFLYTPVFSVLYWPIAILPKWLGPFVWNLGNYTLFILSVFTLPKPYNTHKTKIVLFLLLILEESVFPFQFNIVVAYCFLFSFTLLEKGHGFWAILIIMISSTTKVYGAVELLLLFCYKDRCRHLIYAFSLGALLLLLPTLKTGFSGLIPCYENWWNILSHHQSNGTFASLLYAFPLHSLLPYYRVIQLITICPLIALFFIQHNKWHLFQFRASVLGILMGWIIVFGDSSETHTYLIALSGYMLWYYLQPVHTYLDVILLWGMVVCFEIIPADIFMPTSVHKFINDTLYINVYLFAIAWGKMVWTTFSNKNSFLQQRFSV